MSAGAMQTLTKQQLRTQETQARLLNAAEEVFVRDGYGPGDTVAASVHVDRAEGGIPAGAKVNAIARVDGSRSN